VYLVTGGTGSLGTALAKRLLTDGHKVRTYSRNEHSIERLVAALPKIHHERLSTCMGDVRDLRRLRRAARGCDTVIHAAAQKIVPLAEYDPLECLKTNAMGTANVADACLDEGVERALLVSTDKASAPSTLYGATKLAAERVWLAANRYRPYRQPFRAVRYGNVWGSNGSVIWTFLRQYEAGQPFTVTDPKMTRFHLRMDHAVSLVLSALELAAGELLIPKLPSYMVGDLAAAIDPHWEMTETGRRPGEKMAESLISEHESPYAVDQPEHNRYVLTPGTVQQKGDWEYTSSTNQWRLNGEQLLEEIEWLRSTTAP
jgi:FlaA1/EpsC-like NDP-sugar epimerase